MNKSQPVEANAGDTKARELALTPHQSFIVQAPAGSGKTGLLVQRILRLLSVVDRPESIVAVTFTIKAAAEMRERVVHALREADEEQVPIRDDFHERTMQLARQALSRDQLHEWNLTSDPSRLQIQTIDALCANLVRQMPLVSESGGIGSVTEDADDLYRQAARQALQNLAVASDEDSSTLFQRLALHFDNNIAGLERQIAAMLAKRDQWHAVDSSIADQTVRDFVAIVDRAEGELHDVFRRRNTVDFSEITRAAITALGASEAPSDLLYALDYRIEHLLVDEFQDTSRAQYDLIKSLTGQWSDQDGRTLFLVGDPQQSIYGFRAAEVALFQRCWERQQLGAVRLQPVRLQTNFRSTPQLVQWVSVELAPALSDTNQATGAVALQPALAARLTAGPKPAIFPLLNDRSGVQEAQQVVDLLRRHKSSKDVAILVRSRSHVLVILKWLRKAGLRYQAVEIDPLGEQQHILDLLSLTRALTHLADRAAWLACLRAPWCGLSLADLTAVAEGCRDRTIFDLISDPDIISRLSVDGRVRAVAVQLVFRTALDQVGRTGLRDLLEDVWFGLGGPAILVQQNQREDAETFFDLIESTEQGGIIRAYDVLNDRLSRLYARPDSADTCIKVMTIHEAKGLEFDTVILPHLASPPPGDDEELLVWNETVDDNDQTHLAVAAQPRRGESSAEYDEIRKAAKDKRRNEGKRLFYVACTRAKNHLYVLGSVNENKKRTGVNKAQSHTFLGMIWDRNKAEFEKLPLKQQAAVQADLFEVARSPRSIVRLPDGWRPPAFACSIDWHSDFEQRVASERRVTYDWAGGASRHVGTVVHGLLNQIAIEGPAAWPIARIDDLQTVVDVELARLGVEPANRQQAVGQVLRAVRTVLGSERGRWIMQAHPDARSEWPVSGLIEKRIVSGTVDRLFRDDQKRLWIIDFKTSEHLGSKLHEFLDNEFARYRQQMESYASLLVNFEPGPISLGLYFPLLDGWREWEWTHTAMPAG